jgi:hypothetical protein
MARASAARTAAVLFFASPHLTAPPVLAPACFAADRAFAFHISRQPETSNTTLRYSEEVDERARAPASGAIHVRFAFR